MDRGLADRRLERLTQPISVMTVGGPAIYLLGEALVRLPMIRSLSPQRLLTVLALGALSALGHDLPALALSAAVAAILVGLTVWDHERIRPSSGPFAWITVPRRRGGTGPS
jgi:low temperature requirement protein LtrA